MQGSLAVTEQLNWKAVLSSVRAGGLIALQNASPNKACAIGLDAKGNLTMSRPGRGQKGDLWGFRGTLQIRTLPQASSALLASRLSFLSVLERWLSSCRTTNSQWISTGAWSGEICDSFPWGDSFFCTDWESLVTHQGWSRETQSADVGRCLRHPETCNISFLCSFPLQSPPEPGWRGCFRRGQLGMKTPG